MNNATVRVTVLEDLAVEGFPFRQSNIFVIPFPFQFLI